MNEDSELIERLFSQLPALKNLFIKYPDDVRSPLIIESDDWDNLITPALEEYGRLLLGGTDSVLCAMILRYILESSYCIGYDRGLNEKK